MLLAGLSDGFQSLPPLPTSKLGPSGADSWVGGFVYVLGPCGFFQWNCPVRLGVSAAAPQIFSVRGFVALLPRVGTLGCMDCLTPQLFLPVYLQTNMGPPALPAAALPTPPAVTLHSLVL